MVDPTGMKPYTPPNDYVFNENGNFMRTDINDIPDRLVIENQKTCNQTVYKFADPNPNADAQSMDWGQINKIILVSKDDFENMIK